MGAGSISEAIAVGAGQVRSPAIRELLFESIEQSLAAANAVLDFVAAGHARRRTDVLGRSARVLHVERGEVHAEEARRTSAAADRDVAGQADFAVAGQLGNLVSG